MQEGVAILHSLTRWRGNKWIGHSDSTRKPIENGSERLKHAERREMGYVVMRGPRAMSGITSERAPSPTKQSTLTSPLPPSFRTPDRRPSAHSSQFATRAVKALKKQRRGERGRAGTRGAETLQEDGRTRTDDADAADAPYSK